MPQPTESKDAIVLVHGLLRTSKSMAGLGKFLTQSGYAVYNYRYSSAKYNIEQHGLSLKKYIDEILVSGKYDKIHFVTHSLGGITSRLALSLFSKDQLEKFGCLIMLCPPNKGSLIAKRYTTWFPFLKKIIKPLHELSCSSAAYVHTVAVPEKIMIGIIAARFDRKAPAAVTHLKEERDFILINSTHTFIMNHPKARQAILRFLHGGNF